MTCNDISTFTEIHRNFFLVLVVRKNNRIGTAKNWGKSWILIFDVYIRGITKYKGSVIQFTNGKNNAKYGDRVPGIWILPGTTKLVICSAINGNGNYKFVTKPLGLNKFVSLKIQQMFTVQGKYEYAIFINGKKVLNIVNKLPQLFNRLGIYAGNPWDRPANCVLRKVRFGIIEYSVVEYMKPQKLITGNFCFLLFSLFHGSLRYDKKKDRN